LRQVKQGTATLNVFSFQRFGLNEADQDVDGVLGVP
jgi:hypothetical protein